MYKIHAPIYRLDRKEYVLNKTQDHDIWTDDIFKCKETRCRLSANLTEITRTWTNISKKIIEFQMVFEAQTQFIPSNTLIPCVSINGNQWGNGKEPKGYTYHGKHWIFAGSRSSIPSCTICENRKNVFALFASPENENSLCSSSSLFLNSDGKAIHRIYFPVIEEPVSYIDRDSYGEPYQEYIRLESGKAFTSSVICFTGEPRWSHYGIASLLDATEQLFPLQTKHEKNTPELWELGITFSKSLKQSFHGHDLICIGFGKDKSRGEFVKIPHFEIGWCGQNLTIARMLIIDWMQFHHEDSINLALNILDAWSKELTPTGLLPVHYEKAGTPAGRQADTCNLGNAAMEFLRCYQLLRQLGIEKESYLNSAYGICRFFLQQNGANGFGKLWDIETGNCLSDRGTVGAFIIPALLEFFEFNREEDFLLSAVRAFDFYATRDLDQFCCKAGALDTDCIDKESVAPLLISAIKLFDITKDEKYIEEALKAAYYFSSFMYCYNVPYPKTSDFSKYGFSTCGATAVSTQHHHVDAWGMYLVPQYIRLTELTGDNIWKKRAKAMWDCFTVAISDGSTYIHGYKRPVGSQNEGWMHTRWNNGQQDPKPGTMNDWLVAWPNAFRLATIAELGNTLDSL